jgi:hypothetical protein
MTPVQTAKRPPVAQTSQQRAPITKPPLPNNNQFAPAKISMDQSFYDNVDMQEPEKQQQRFVSRFGRQQPRTSVTRLEDQGTPPPSDPEQPKPFGSRKESSDSIFSNTSRESIISMTSTKADIKLRRNFNY